MAVNYSEETWKEYIENFSSYEGTVTDYCKENCISKNQYYYYLKKFKTNSTSTFHAIDLKEKSAALAESRNDKEGNKNIRIEFGSVNIYIPSENSALISSIIKELLKSC